MAENNKRTVKETVRTWLNVQNTERIYLALQFVFWALLCALLMVCVQGIDPLIPVIYGTLLFLLSLNAKKKVFRFFVRAIPFAALSVMAVALVGFFFVAQDISGVTSNALLTSERVAYVISYLVTAVQPLLLMTLPAWILSALLSKRQTDNVLLHLGSWITVLFALGTLCLYYYHQEITGFLMNFGTFSFFIFSVDLLLWFYLIAAVAFAFAVYMLYPFANKRIKKAVEAARAKLPHGEDEQK